MPGQGERDRVQVRFAGPRSATGPLTWAQRGTFDEMQRYLPGSHSWLFIVRRIPVPGRPSRDEVLRQIGEWISRHEALHTRFCTGDDGAVSQEVAQSGTFDVEVVNYPAGESTDVAHTEIRRLRKTFVHRATDLPLRVVLVSIDAVPTVVIVCVSHLLADYGGASVADDDLTAMLAAHADGKRMPEPLAAREPVDQALYENSAAGRRVNDKALAHVGSQLSAGLRGVPAKTPHPYPRYRVAFLRSDALSRSARVLAERYATSPSVVFLAVTSALLSAVTHSPQHTVGLVCHNRFRPELRCTVGNLAQRAVATLDANVATMSELVAVTGKVALRSYVRGQYDTRGIAEMINNHDPGFGIPYRFNDTWSGAAERETSHPAAAPDDDTSTQPAESAFSWGERYDKDDLDMVMYLDVGGLSESVELRALVDTYRIADGAVEPFLRGFEHLMAELVRHDVPLSDVAGLFHARCVAADTPG